MLAALKAIIHNIFPMLDIQMIILTVKIKVRMCALAYQAG
jgi:hypothetical protein